MSDKSRKIVAIIALFWMAIFTVSLIISLIDLKFMNGLFGYLALISGGVGISLWFVIYLANKRLADIEKAVDDLAVDDDDDDDTDDDLSATGGGADKPDSLDNNKD